MLNRILKLCRPLLVRHKFLILTYHRVTATPDSLLPSEPDAESFREHLKWITNNFQTLSLRDAVARLTAGESLTDSLVITFDDGYKNNLEVAAPLLEDFGCDATFFVTTEALETGIMWNDIVIEAVRCMRGSVDLSEYGLGFHSINKNRIRIELIQALLDRLKYLPLQDRHTKAVTLYENTTEAPLPRLMMTDQEVRELGSKFEVGGHTHKHPILHELDDSEALLEIQQNKTLLEGLVGYPLISFAYPNGRPGRDFSLRDCNLVKSLGYKAAVSTEWACATAKSDRFSLPRYSMAANSETEFLEGSLRLYARATLPP